MEERTFKLELVGDKEKVKALALWSGEQDKDSLEIPAIPRSAFVDYIESRRDTIWTVTDDSNVEILRVTGERDSVRAAIKMLSDYKAVEFPFPPIPLGNLIDYVEGSRNNVAQVEFKYVKEEDKA
jgi:hypothetical protein